MILFERNSWLWISFFTVLCLACGKSIGDPDGDKDDPKPSNITEVNVTTFKSSSADDREMIQKAIDYARSNNIHKVFVPDGTYQINAVSTFLLSGILLRDGTQLRLSDKAILKAIPNSSSHYSIVTANGVSNATIEGGTIQGERYEHTGTAGEGGMGITIANANNITVKNITLKDCWGDGIYIRNGSKQITIDNVIADNNRRQGMSVIAVDGLLVKNSIWKNTNGKNPMAGIDLEPNNTEDIIKNVQIINNQFLDNEALGLHIWGRHGQVRDVSVKDCVMSGSPVGLSMRHEYTSNITVEDVVITGSTTRGVMIGENAKQINIDGIKVTTADGIGIRAENTSEVVMRNLDVDAHTSGISLNRATLMTIENANVKSMVNHTGNGIYGANCDNITVSHTEVKGWSHGVNSVSLNYFTFSNSKITGSSQFGVFLSNNKHSLFENNVYANNRQIAHYIRSGGDGLNQVINNEFVDNSFETPNTYAQITIAESARMNTLSGNIFRTSSHANKPKHAIRLDNSTSNNTVTGNTFETGSYATSAVQDDTNGQNQTN